MTRVLPFIFVSLTLVAMAVFQAQYNHSRTASAAPSSAISPHSQITVSTGQR